MTLQPDNRSTIEDRYRTFMQLSSEGIWYFELEEPVPTHLPEDEQIEAFYRYGYLVECNDVMAQMYGFESASDLAEVRLEDLLIRTDPRNIEYLRSFIRSGYRLTDGVSHEAGSDGRLRYFSNNLKGIVKDGSLVGAWGTQRDVTEQKKLEVVLRASEEKFRSHAEAIPQIVWITRPDGWHEYYNGHWYDYTGMSPEESIGWGWSAPLHPEDKEKSIQRWEQAISSGEPYVIEYRFRARDGSYRWFLGRALPVRDENGDIVQWFGTCTDIEDQKRTEELLCQRERELQMERNRLADLFMQAPAFITVLRGPEHVFELVNPPYLQLVGYRDLLGKTVRDALPELEGQGLFELVDEVYRTGQPFVGQDVRVLVQQQQKGPLVERHLDFIYQPILDAEGAVTGIFALGLDVTERKRAVEALRESEMRFRAIFNQVTVGIVLTDLTGRFLMMNQRFCDIVGYSEERLLQLKMQDITHPEDLPRNLQLFQRMVTEGENFSIEKRYLKPDGTPVWVDNSITLVKEEGGAAPYVTAVVLDVTERKRAEEALLMHSRVLKSMTEGVSVTDEEGVILYTNPAEEAIFGYGPGELIGQHVTVQNAYPPEENQRRVAEVIETLKTQGAWQGEWLNRRKDGSTFLTFARITALEMEGKSFWVCVQDDITQRRELEVELQHQRELLQTITDNADSALVMLDSSGYFTFVNPAFTRITGYTKEDLQGKPVHDAVHYKYPDGRPFPIEECPIDNSYWNLKPIRGLQEVFVRKDGSLFPVVAAVAPLEKDGETVGGVLEFRDVTEEKEMERLLREAANHLADMNRQKDEFLAMLAHELRNPLAPILTATHLMKMKDLADPALQRIQDTVERQVLKMSRLVDDLLDVARITRGMVELKKATVDLASVLTHTVQTVRPEIDRREQRLYVSLSPEPLWIEADPTRLEQIITNLLTNSSKFTEQGGEIRISVERDGGEAIVRVRDTGKGISQHHLPYIFDLFTQVNPTIDRAEGGLGLGLTLVKNLTQQHGGSVEAHSEGPGKGSEFVVRLPLLQTSLPTQQEEKKKEERAELSLRVLVVDDNRDAAQTLADLLPLWGVETRSVYGSREALQAAREFRPDAILLDIGLPEMDGYEVAKALRANPATSHMRLIALTGYGQEEDRQRTAEAGFDEHLVKPADLLQLQKLLTQVEEEKRRK
jgi:PAS domain S-box-containing protein